MKKPIKKPTKKSLKKKLTTLHNTAWRTFSLYIRHRDKGKCFTCGVVKKPSEMHAGHFHHGYLDFDEKNIHCQCVACNKFRHGNLAKYAQNLVIKYGHSILDELDELRIAERSRVDKTGIRYTLEELEDILAKYRGFV